MQHLGPAMTAALVLTLAPLAAAQPATPLDGAASGGFAERATRFLDEARRRNCDARPDGLARQACVDAALATVYPAGFASRSGEQQ